MYKNYFKEAEILRDFSIDHIDRNVERCCRSAAQTPLSFYLFMQRYTHFNGYAGPLVTRLASAIGLSRDLFSRPNCAIVDEQDIGCEIANKIFRAAIDEYGDAHIQASHRTAAQSCLHHVGLYAGLTEAERNRFSKIPEWLTKLLEQAIAGYQGALGQINQLLYAMGYHASSEILAHHEYQIIDRVIRHELADQGFDAYLRSKTLSDKARLTFHNHQIHPWFWISIHGNEQGGGVEKDHFDLALEGLNQALESCSEENRPVLQKKARQGFQDFCTLQQQLFHRIEQECNFMSSQVA